MVPSLVKEVGPIRMVGPIEPPNRIRQVGASKERKLSLRSARKGKEREFISY